MMNTTTTTAKNTTIELSVNPEYVPNWGVWEALRELLQNAADADDKGYAMSISRTKSGTIKIYNDGADLSRDTLLLGTSSKRGDDTQRGKFGEGYKLALLVLSRANVQVVAHTRYETWTPVIEHSERFGADVVKVKVRSANKPRDGLTFLIKGISERAWDQIQQRCLFLRKPADGDAVEVSGGTLLTGEQYKGLLFSRGLFVGQLPNDYGYGYDLPHVELDRDRKLADPWSLRWEISRVFKRAFERDAIDVATAIRMLNSDTGEADALKNNVGYHDDAALVDRVAEAFLSEHGENAVAVTNMEASTEAAHVGLKGVVVSGALAAVVERKLGDLQTRKQQRNTEPTKLYSIFDLEEDEAETYRWGVAVVDCVDNLLAGVEVQIVDFIGDNINGTFHYNTDDKAVVRIARRRLAERKHYISTLVHEVAHQFGSDGSVEHERAIQNIFAELVAGFVS